MLNTSSDFTQNYSYFINKVQCMIYSNYVLLYFYGVGYHNETSKLMTTYTYVCKYQFEHTS